MNFKTNLNQIVFDKKKYLLVKSSGKIRRFVVFEMVVGSGEQNIIQYFLSFEKIVCIYYLSLRIPNSKYLIICSNWISLWRNHWNPG